MRDKPTQTLLDSDHTLELIIDLYQLQLFLLEMTKPDIAGFRMVK